MSHFSVLVIGENIEQQLAPYHEFECTGYNDEYVQDVDVTQESIEWGTDKETGEFSLEDALGYHGLEDKIVTDLSEVDVSDEHKYGYALVQNGNLVKAINRTNPNRQWDWWVIGGRWTGHLRLKDGAQGSLGEAAFLGRRVKEGHADQALKKDIDFDGMMEIAGINAGLEWDRVHAEISEDDFTTLIPWEKLRDEVHKGNIDAAIEAYREQLAVKKFNTLYLGFSNSVERYNRSREDFVNSARDKAISTFAVVKDGKWYQRGEMGWWGMVSDEKDGYDWCAEFASLVEGLPDDTLLTVVDCHI